MDAAGVGIGVRGTPGYISPEMWFQHRYYGYRSDSWSVGCMMLEMLTGMRICEIAVAAGDKLEGSKLAQLCEVVEAGVKLLPAPPEEVQPELPVSPGELLGTPMLPEELLALLPEELLVLPVLPEEAQVVEEVLPVLPADVLMVLRALLHPDGTTRPVAADVVPLVEAALQRLREQQ